MSTLAHRMDCHDGNWDADCRECTASVPKTMITQADLVLTRPDGRVETIRLGAFTATYHLTVNPDPADGEVAVKGELDVAVWLRECVRLLEAGVANLRRQLAILEADASD